MGGWWVLAPGGCEGAGWSCRVAYGRCVSALAELAVLVSLSVCLLASSRCLELVYASAGAGRAGSLSNLAPQRWELVYASSEGWELVFPSPPLPTFISTHTIV